jgi:hypothetical protein
MVYNYVNLVTNIVKPKKKKPEENLVKNFEGESNSNSEHIISHVSQPIIVTKEETKKEHEQINSGSNIKRRIVPVMIDN